MLNKSPKPDGLQSPDRSQDPVRSHELHISQEHDAPDHCNAHGEIPLGRVPAMAAGVSFASSLEFRDVTLTRGSKVVLDRISLSLDAGEILCLLGASGSGKTSLMLLAAGLLVPDSGSILRDGVEISGKRFVPPEKRGIGMIFQDYALFPHLTVLENCTFGLSGLSRDVAQRAARDALRRVGIEELAERYPSELSGGESQRCALARSVAPRPGILLLDEPFSNLDRRRREEIRDQTIAIFREVRASCILVTHDSEEALKVADRIALLHNGAIIQISPGSQLFRQPRSLVAARCFGELNEIVASMRSGKVVSRLGTCTRDDVPDGEVVMCWRSTCLEVEKLEGDFKAEPLEQKATPFAVGAVRAARYMGSYELLEIEISGILNIVKARVGGIGKYQVGETVKVRGPEACAMIFSNQQ